MVQIGWSAGARHARAWGNAKSYSKPVSSEARVANDHDVIACFSLLWFIICFSMPAEIVDSIEALLTAAGMPRFATDNVSGGQ